MSYPAAIDISLTYNTPPPDEVALRSAITWSGQPADEYEEQKPCVRPRFLRSHVRCAGYRTNNVYHSHIDQALSYTLSQGATNRPATCPSYCTLLKATDARALLRSHAYPTLEPSIDGVCYGSSPTISTTAESCHTPRQVATPPPSPQTRCTRRPTIRTSDLATRSNCM